MTQLLKHKDYQGSVCWEDGRLVVKILHIDDVVIDECLDASTVEDLFRELVDDYIATCEAAGRPPCKPFKGVFQVRVDTEVHRRAAMAAARADLSLNAWVEASMREHLSREERAVEILSMARHRFLQQKSELTGYVGGSTINDPELLKVEFLAVMRTAAPRSTSGHH